MNDTSTGDAKTSDIETSEIKTSDITDWRSGKGHRNENFPVASFLIHPRHRSAILAFYNFVRTADDIADHAALAPQEKLDLLDRLDAGLVGENDDDAVAIRLRDALAERALSPRHAQDLLAAFKLDVTKLRYRDWDDLISYCSLSAMPVGRFVLDVHGESRSTWPANDALCAALQIINHLQDCKDDCRDLDRVYIPLDLLAAHGIGVEALGAPRASPALLAALHSLRQRRLPAPDQRPAARARSLRHQYACASADALAYGARSLERAGATCHACRRRPDAARHVPGRVSPAGPALHRHHAKAAGCVSEQANSGGRARFPQLVLYWHAHTAARAARGDVRNLFVLPRRRRHR